MINYINAQFKAVSVHYIGDHADSEGIKTSPDPIRIREDDYLRSLLLKYFFDNFKGNQEDVSFILNGGFVMKNWVNDQLRRMRDGIHMTKRNKMDTGMQNQFIKPHEKKDFTNVRKSQEHSSTLNKYDVAVTESLKRINEIISKL